MKQPAVIQRFTKWQEAIAQYQKGAGHVVVRYTPDVCSLFQNEPIYADVMSITVDEDGCSWVDLRGSGAIVNFFDIQEWILINPGKKKAFTPNILHFLSADEVVTVNEKKNETKIAFYMSCKPAESYSRK